MSAPLATTPAPRVIPGLAEPFLVGSMPAMQQDRLGLFARVARECGDIGLLHFGPLRGVFMNAAELAQSVLVEREDAFDKGLVLHRAFTPMIGQGLINNEGAAHRRQRKLIAPVFVPRSITAYAATMAAYADEAQAVWAEGAAIDIAHEVTNLTMRIVSKTLFDNDVLTATDDLGAAITTALEFMQYTLDHYFPMPLSVPTPRSRRTRRALALIDHHIHTLIAARRRTPGDRTDLLSLLLSARDESGQGMSDRQLRDEALTLFVTGHESTANVLAWAFYLLATHPEVYIRLQQEATSVLGGRRPTVEDLPRLPYALQVFKEAMRLYPPAHAIERTALRDVAIGGYPIRKNDIVIIVPYTMHRQPDYFPDPLRFDPDHFTPEAEKRLPRYAYLPFGAGPRVCIGSHFALMEGQIILAALAQRVIFRLVPGQQIVPQPVFTLRQQYGCRVIVHRRSVL